MPKPRAMPWTNPKASCTAKAAAERLSSTGTAIAPMTHGERKRQNSNAAPSTLDRIDRRSTSPRIWCAASRAKTAGPVMSRRAGPGRAEAKAPLIAASARSCAVTSMPPARVRARMSARSRPGANHTPATVRTGLVPIQARPRARNACPGSANPNRSASGEAEDRSSSSRASKSRRSAGTVKAAGVVSGDRR